MKNFDLDIYCSSFIIDQKFGQLIFYKDQNHCYSYKDLMLSVYAQAEKNTDSFSALKINSSYQLFIHLLAASMTKKKVVILSDKGPKSAILDYQKRLGFENIITDDEPKKCQNLNLTNYTFDMERPAFFILSSGSSGPSKSIGLSLKNIYYSAKNIIHFFNMTHSDCTFLNLPHHHIGGLMILWRAFFCQSSVTKNEDDNYQFVSLVPLQLKRSLENPLKLKRLQNCRGVLIGGAPLPLELKAAAVAQNIPLYETYGMSETSSLVMLNGNPLEGIEIKLNPENYFLIKSPTLSSQVPRDRDGFFQTKDIGVKNADGTFSFKQRGDLLFKSAGEMIDPVFIEEKIRLLPWITMAVITPVPHPDWTWAGSLIYQTNDHSKNADDIKSHLKNVLHPHHIPKYFIEAPKDFISEEMKPKRYEISKWVKEKYLNELISSHYIPAINAKKLIVFFHGFMEDLNDMTDLIDKRLEASYLFVDIPGHGKTKATSLKKREDFFSIIGSLIEFYLDGRELIIYGYSMGGRIALELSAFYLRPHTLILESAHFGLETDDLKNTRLIQDRSLLTAPNLDLESFFTQWYKNPIFANYNQSAQYQREIAKKLNHDVLEWQQSLEFFSPGATQYLQSDLVDKLKNLKIVGITGTADQKYSGHYKEIKKILPHFSHHEISNAGHNPHKTHLEEIKTILVQVI